MESNPHECTIRAPEAPAIPWLAAIDRLTNALSPVRSAYEVPARAQAVASGSPRER